MDMGRVTDTMAVDMLRVIMAVDTHLHTTVVIHRAITTDMHLTQAIAIAGSFDQPMLIMAEAPAIMAVGTTGAIATGKPF